MIQKKQATMPLMKKKKKKNVNFTMSANSTVVLLDDALGMASVESGNSAGSSGSRVRLIFQCELIQVSALLFRPPNCHLRFATRVMFLKSFKNPRSFFFTSLFEDTCLPDDDHIVPQTVRVVRRGMLPSS